MRHFNLIRLDSRKSNSPANKTNASAPHRSLLDVEPTRRELEVEDLLCRGYSQQNIAALFGRSLSTISVHTMSLYRKRGVNTQVGLLLAYLERRGILVFDEESAEFLSNRSITLEAAQ